eukprot:TRINITY_DN14953_c0_g1_i1.p1 TRINITY_DN14953_c0_g1~~TRINITY_DN14953_c0_g1_i1.p1  ORF type:complete len:241 (+),score=62.48 TRINITY_DN14953_c0_g1_i1:89-811(+)
MGCAGARPAPPDDPNDVVYDKKWDDLRERYKAARSGRGSDGEPALEPGQCSYGMKKSLLSVKAALSLKISGISFKPSEPPPESPGKPGPTYLSSRDRNKIHQWLEGVAEHHAMSASARARGSMMHHRSSVHTVYSQDDEEELVRANSMEGFSSTPQRLTDKRCINRLQTQLKQRNRELRKGASMRKVDGDVGDVQQLDDAIADLEPASPSAMDGVDEEDAGSPVAPMPELPGASNTEEGK